MVRKGLIGREARVGQRPIEIAREGGRRIERGGEVERPVAEDGADEAAEREAVRLEREHRG